MQVNHPRPCAIHLDDGENKFIRLIERRQNFVACYGHGGGAYAPSFDLNKPEAGPAVPLALRNDRLNVVANVLLAHILGSEAACSLALHHCVYGSRLNGCTIYAEERASVRTAHEPIEQSQRNDEGTAHDHRRAG